MPPECKKFVDDVHSFTATTGKILFGLPFHKIWRTKQWKELVNSLDGILTYTGHQVNQKIKKIEREEKEEADEAGENQAELEMDFLTNMIHSGKMSVNEIAVNAMDLLTAGVDTVSEVIYIQCEILLRWL